MTDQTNRVDGITGKGVRVSTMDSPQILNESSPATAEPLPSRQAASAQFYFTKANAKAMAAKSHAAKAQRKADRLKALADDAKPEPDSYRTERLARVRKQLSRLDSMMERESDPQKLDRLASAQYRLSEQERILAGRPNPGSLRPKPQSSQHTDNTTFAPES